MGFFISIIIYDACFFKFSRYDKAPDGHRFIWLIIFLVSVPSKFIQGIILNLNTSDNSKAHFSACMHLQGS